jgi:opacity protein-like surface antigen
MKILIAMIISMLIVGSFVTSAVAQESSGAAQNFEVTFQVGGQINGGYDLSTSLFNRIEVANSVNYGITTGYLVGEHAGIEFQWNHNSADTSGQAAGISSAKLFSLNQNQYMGNFLFHLTSREAKMRPFLFFGLGANSLSANVSGVSGSTRFAYALGGGAKYNISRHFGLRGQLRWAPTYLGTTNGGYWCDPIWGGCWAVGNSHYLHEFDITGGLTLRF